jgi:hypothetical protein
MVVLFLLLIVTIQCGLSYYLAKCHTYPCRTINSLLVSRDWQIKMRIELDPIRELILLAGLASLGLGMDWAQQDSWFALVFATEAGWAAVEAFYLSA